MAHLIDRDALLAEIERLKKNEGWCQVGKDTADVYYARGFRFACERIISFIDTLEVKEVNLDGISRHYALNNSPWDDCRDEIQDAYKAGFELGMQVSNKAQKGKRNEHTDYTTEESH